MKIFQVSYLHPRYWPSWVGLLLMRLSIFLPPKLQLYIGLLLGRLMRPFMSSRAGIARRNLELCFPDMTEQQREQILEKNLRTLGLMMIETAVSWWAKDEALEKRVRYNGLEHLEAAKAEGKGVILLTGHFTSMEMGGRLIILKTPAYVMFRFLKNKLFNAVMMNARTFHSEGTVMRDDIRAMVRALKKGKVVWYAPDQDFGRKNSLFAKFFGQTAATIPATSKLVKMTGAKVVPFVPKREDDGSYTISIDPAWENFPTGDDIADAQRVNDWVAEQIRKAPDQYYWVHRRFKTQPDSEKSEIYKKASK